MRTTDLFFSIKPVRSDSLAYVPFLIRAQWSHTTWTKIGFSFIAEDRNDVESGYYQVDTGSLGSCSAGKEIEVLLPFRKMNSSGANINHTLFLHGFEMSVQKYNETTYSPFEVQIANSNANSSGISVVVSVTSITQVHGLHISYLAWTTPTLKVAMGSFVFNAGPSSPNSDIWHSVGEGVGANFARINGVTGFIINHSFQDLSLSITWTGSKFMFNLGSSQKLTQYLSFSYLFFIGSECTGCTGFEISYNGICVSECPPGTSRTFESTCIKCGDGYFWDGAKCQKLCPSGQFLNVTNNECECPQGSGWTGSICLSCVSGRVFSSASRTCECPAGSRWNGFACTVSNPCVNGQIWDVFTFSCKCPGGTVWTGSSCFKPPRCSGGQYLDGNNQCVCPDGTFFKNNMCQTNGCTGGQTYNGRECACNSGENWNGTVCLICINGQHWDPSTSSCLCDAGYNWNGIMCQKEQVCSGGRTFMAKYGQCLCQEGSFWNGAQCITRPQCCCGKTWNETSLSCECPLNFNWDGHTCLVCANGKAWVPASRSCACPPGTQWNNQFCTVIQSCGGGMIWNQNTWTCECSASMVWNGNYCAINPCTNGMVWDTLKKNCSCPPTYQLVDSKCVLPQLYCTYGRSFDAQTSTCVCPSGQFDSGSSCQQIPACLSNQVYSPINNKCTCPPGLVWLQNKNACTSPTCPSGQRWNGNECIEIACPPGSVFNGTDCISPDVQDRCSPWEYFDGLKCVYFLESCPAGTAWTGKFCNSTGNCPTGFYSQSGSCVPLPQNCIPPTVWSNNRCLATSGCPLGSIKSGSSCQPYSSCQNGQVWNSSLLQCLCPSGTGWSGKECVRCGQGQIWDTYEGCTCPTGFFFAGDQCERVAQDRCINIPNALWNAALSNCMCYPGYTVVGQQCICKGVPYENFCDRCSFRPNSQWKFGMCQCKTGYTQFGSECLPNQSNGNDAAVDCNTGTFFDGQQKKCLPCPDGCLSCSDCYTCQVCSPDFIYDPASQLCMERCGDGHRYVKECDDGNSVSGDGCDMSCKVEGGFSCKGGSPNSADTCVPFTPTAVTLVQSGQVRYATSILLNIKLNYLPMALTQSDSCNDRCSQVLVATII